MLMSLPRKRLSASQRYVHLNHSLKCVKQQTHRTVELLAYYTGSLVQLRKRFIMQTNDATVMNEFTLGHVNGLCGQ